MLSRIDRIDSTYPSPVDGEHYCSDPETYDHGTVWTSDPELTDAENASEAARDVLRRSGACCPSASHFHPGMWYSTEEQTDWRTGDLAIESFFIRGSEAFQRALAREFVALGLGRVAMPIELPA